MSKSKIFILGCLAFALGVFLASKFSLPEFSVYLGLLGCVVFLCVGMFKDNSKFPFKFIALSLLFISLGVGRFNFALEENHFSEALGPGFSREGLVVAEPDVRDNRQLLAVLPKGETQKILITTTKTQEFFYGDWIVVSGKLQEAKAFDDFDYAGYLERFNIYAVMAYPKILILKSDRGNLGVASLLKLKQSFSRHLQKFIPEPESSLALGILIGAKRGLPIEQLEAFHRTGTSHIVAISGFNIAIIVWALSVLAWVFGRRVSFWLSLVIIFGFVIIAGASASVIRAGVMGGLLLLAFNIGRLYSVMPALIFVATLMIFFNPKILYWDSGFQLSFAATFGIVVFMPLWDKLTEAWSKFFGLKNIFFVTLSAVLATLPISLANFGQLSLVALPVNLLILPVVPFAMLFGFLTIIPGLSAGLALVAQSTLSYILWVVTGFGRLSWASVPVSIGFGTQLGLWLSLIGIYFGVRFWALKKVKMCDKVSKDPV